MSMEKKRWLFALFLTVLICGNPGVSMGDSPEKEPRMSPVPLPEGVGKIPGPRQRKEVLLLTKDNVALFNELLLAPLASWLDAGLFTARLVSHLDFSWRLSEEWEKASESDLGEFDLDDSFSLSLLPEMKARIGLPFGRANIVDLEEDKIRKAYKILWNLAAMEASIKDILYDIELSWIGSQSLLRQSKGVFYRRFYSAPDAVSAVLKREANSSSAKENAGQASSAKDGFEKTSSAFFGPTELLRQEVLQLTSPSVVFGYAQISWRYWGEQEDRGWIYSPVIGKSRRVFSSNRSDLLLGGLLSFDDFFVWSAKIQSATVKVVDDKVLLVPFPALTYYHGEFDDFSPSTRGQSSVGLEGEEGVVEQSKLPSEKVFTVRGYHQRFDSAHSMVRWNHEMRSFPGKAPWLPSTAVFVPRRVWILELSSKDPFSPAGREILIVDKEAMLPVYKISYDHYGVLQRLVFGAWGLVRSKDGKTIFPFASFALAVDKSGRRAMAASTQTVRSFLGKESAAAKKIRMLLDIEEHGKTQKEGEAPASKETAADQPQPSNLSTRKAEN